MDKNIHEIINLIKQGSTNDERISIILKQPIDIIFQLLYHFSEIYIEPFSKNNILGFRTIKNEEKYNALLFSIIRSLPENYRIKFLKSQSDAFKKKYLDKHYLDENDSLILSLIQSSSDFPYKLVFANMLKNEEIQNQQLKEIGVKNSVLYYIDNLNIESLSSTSKYSSIGIPEEITFGIEIECYNRDYATFLRDLKQLFTFNFLGCWSCKRDSTICADAPIEKNIFPDLEVVSSPLIDSALNVKQIYDICGFLNDLGFKTNNYCGGHIHFGRNYFETPKQLWNLISLYGINEDVLNLIINEPNSLPRDSMNRYAKSTYKLLQTNNINVDDYTDIDEFYSEIHRLQNGKDYDINISTTNPTIEFRGANSTLNPDAWIENIKLFGTLMVVAKGLETGNLKNFEQKKELFLKLKTEKDINKKCNLLLNLLFDNEKDRAIYRERFEKNFALQFNMQDYTDLCNDQKEKTEENYGRN